MLDLESEIIQWHGIHTFCHWIFCFHNGVFHGLYKVGRNGNFVFKGFKNSKKKLPPVGFDLMLQIITGLGLQCLARWAKQTFAYKFKTFRSLYSHALLIIAKSSQFL